MAYIFINEIKTNLSFRDNEKTKTDAATTVIHKNECQLTPPGLRSLKRKKKILTRGTPTPVSMTYLDETTQ